jgi:hypothetical protein
VFNSPQKDLTQCTKPVLVLVSHLVRLRALECDDITEVDRSDPSFNDR